MNAKLKQWLADIEVNISADVEQQLAVDEHTILSLRSTDRETLQSLGFKAGPVQCILDNGKAGEKEQKALEKEQKEADETAEENKRRAVAHQEMMDGMKLSTEAKKAEIIRIQAATAEMRRAAASKTDCVII